MSSVQKPPSIVALLKTQGRSSDAVDVTADRYLRYFDPSRSFTEVKQKRLQNASDVTNSYYDVATDFYEYGWGEGFHFATLRRGESREHSFAKYEYSLALRLKLEPGDLVLDAGCGIGGPARHIAAFSEAKVVGVNLNDYQLERARTLTKMAKLEDLCFFEKGDYHNMAYEDGTFDKAYAIEATCHSPNLAKVYGEILRVLKPGGLFICCEWIVTDKYDDNNSYHRKLKQDILEGDALSDLLTTTQVIQAVKDSGFEMIDARDYALESEVPWQTVLQAQWTVSDLKITPLGRWLTHATLTALEAMHLAPRGSTKVHRMLCKGADALAAAGDEGIFSPMYVLLLRKPTRT